MAESFESTKKNAARNQRSRLGKIKKQVSYSWGKSQNPNLFGGGPVLDPSGRIVSMNVSAYGYVAAFLHHLPHLLLGHFHLHLQDHQREGNLSHPKNLRTLSLNLNLNLRRSQKGLCSE